MFVNVIVEYYNTIVLFKNRIFPGDFPLPLAVGNRPGIYYKFFPVPLAVLGYWKEIKASGPGFVSPFFHFPEALWVFPKLCNFILSHPPIGRVGNHGELVRVENIYKEFTKFILN